MPAELTLTCKGYEAELTLTCKGYGRCGFKLSYPLLSPIYITFGANSTWELKCDILCFKVKVNVKVI